MKYSVGGTLPMSGGDSVIDTINSYTLWRLVTSEQEESLVFEAWVNTSEAKDSLFSALKTHVDTHTGRIDWHECSHDEATPQPCVIVETYVRG